MERRKTPDPIKRDLTYKLLNGFVELEGEPPSSDTMKITFLAELIYQHRINLCKRTNLDFEDKDLEAIISTYETLNRLCSELMYNYGWHAGNRTYEVYEL